MNTTIQITKISDLILEGILEIGDGYRAKNDELSSSGLPFARAGNINDGFNFQNADHFPENNLHRVGGKVSKPGDVVFTSKGTVGRFSLVNDTTPPFVYSPQLCYWRVLDRNIIEPRFLYYWMCSREFFLQYTKVKSQTDMADYVSLTDQRRMYISLPSIVEQRAISYILGSLDDKIELNRKMNATLEETMSAIFNAWFIEFEPVRTKMRGNAPQSCDAATAALFPDTLDVVEGRELPKGWKILLISDITRILGGSTPSTQRPEFWDGGTFHWATPKDLSNQKEPILLSTDRCITEAGVKQISSGVLPKGSVLLSSRAPIGYIAIAAVPTAINQGFIGLICDQGISNYFILNWLKSNLEEIKGRANGTTFQEVSKSNFRTMGVVTPTSKISQAYTEIAQTLYEKIVANLLQSDLLASLRDSLLPKLSSGEMSVRDAESFVENT